MRLLTALAGVSATAWTVLLAGHGRSWRTVPRLPAAPEPAVWPDVGVVVPARDEAALLPTTLPTLLAQDYPGRLHVRLVDDASTDGTAAVARALAGDGRVPLTVLDGTATHAHADPDSRVGGATHAHADPDSRRGGGKVAALRRGVAASPEEFLLFTDADIAHEPGSVRRLVAAALADDRDLVSLMALLHAGTAWERALVPAFVYFFAQLYPFVLVARPDRRTAAAAGGCVLLRRAALERAGGLARIEGAVIDDVALGGLLKRAGSRIWLGFTGERPEVRSVRAHRFAELWAMVARSAYPQLRHSPALLAGTLAGLALLHGVPPVAAAAGLLRRRPAPAALGFAAWVALAASQAPVLRLYGLSPARGPALPAVAALYGAMTLDSARRHRTGTATWRGRSVAGNAACGRSAHGQPRAKNRFARALYSSARTSTAITRSHAAEETTEAGR